MKIPIKTAGAISAVLALAGAAFATANPTLGDASATVSTSVSASAPAPCLVLSGTPALNFGTNVPFSTAGAPVTRTVDAATAPNYVSCATVPQNVMVRTSSMRDAGGTASWSVTGGGINTLCNAPNVFNLRATQAGSAIGLVAVSADSLAQSSLAAGATGTDWAWTMGMPCEGSAGSGLAMSGALVFTAVFP